MTEIYLQFLVDNIHTGKRLDQVVPQLFVDYSRSRLQLWIKSGQLLVDGQVKKPKDKLLGGETLTLSAKAEEQVALKPEDIALPIVYEDDYLLVVNKPTNMVVHPAPGNLDGTMQNALLFHDKNLVHVPRAGIVHRLDKDTTGLLVVAKSLKVHKYLVDQLQQRLIKREYLALVNGVVTVGGTVDEPLGRHPKHRVRMAVVRSGKNAVTHYQVQRRYRGYSLLAVQLETGRTHQIRVHLAHIRYPITGDQVYGGRLRLAKDLTEPLRDALSTYKRQALHARRLGLSHPETGEWMEWEVPLPDDFASLLDVMKEDANAD